MIMDLILADAIHLLETRGWTQGAYARGGNGGMTSYTDPDAACYCAFGAILAAAHRNEKEPLVDDVWRVVRRQLVARNAPGIAHSGSFSDWNDHPERTKEEVIALLRQAKEEIA